VATVAAHPLRTGVGYLAAHAVLLLSGIGLWFLQQHIWVQNIGKLGYGQYQSTPYIVDVSAFVVLVDLIVLWWALKGSKLYRRLSLLWPGIFFLTTLAVLVANNA